MCAFSPSAQTATAKKVSIADIVSTFINISNQSSGISSTDENPLDLKTDESFHIGDLVAVHIDSNLFISSDGCVFLFYNSYMLS